MNLADNSNFQNSPKFKNFSIDSFKDGNEFRLKVFEFGKDENYSVGLNDSTLKELNNVQCKLINSSFLNYYYYYSILVFFCISKETLKINQCSPKKIKKKLNQF